MYIYICVYYVNDCNYIICAYTVNMYSLGFDLVSIASLIEVPEKHPTGPRNHQDSNGGGI